MNAETWRGVLDALSRWWAGLGSAEDGYGCSRRGLAASIERRPVASEPSVVASSLRVGRRYFVDPPAAARVGDWRLDDETWLGGGGLRSSLARPRKSDGDESTTPVRKGSAATAAVKSTIAPQDVRRSAPARDGAIGARKASRLVSAIHTYLAVRNRRMAPRHVRSQSRPSYRPEGGSARNASAPESRKSWTDGEGASMEPP
jgi:hypothetical protein